jgi:hypothetical protein
MTDGTCGLPIINVRNRFLGKPARRKTSSIARAGRWAFDIASKIGVSVAAEALKKAIGLG